MSQKQSQRDRILAHLQTGAGITPLEALSLFGCFRLATRIFELKKLGYGIETDMIEKGEKRYANYRLVSQPATESAEVSS